MTQIQTRVKQRLEQLPLRWIKAALLATAWTAGLLALLNFSADDVNEKSATLIVRKVDVALPPPPPPPPPAQQPVTQSNAMDLSIDGDGKALPISFAPAQIQTEIHIEQPPVRDLTQPDWDFDLEQDWQSFGLDQLDQSPRLLTPIRVEFPDSLQKRGIRKAQAKLHIIINERGVVILKNITYIDYPELKGAISQAVQQARFTPPLKSGKVVNAEFIWPLQLTHS